MEYVGSVIWFSNKEGYGFIARENEKDLFVHFSGIISEEGTFRTLRKDQKVSFEIGRNVKGEDVAVNVKVIN